MITYRIRPEAGDNSNGRHKSKSVDNQNIRLQQYVDKAVVEILASVSNAGRGGRNAALNRSAYDYGRLLHYVARDRAETELMVPALDIGLDPDEAKITIKSGLDAGAKNLRDLSHIGGNGQVRSVSRRGPVQQIKQTVQPDPKEHRTRKYVSQLWKEAQPAKGTLAAVYLQERLLGPFDDNIRFISGHKHTGTGQYLPVCLFGLSNEPDGELVALQRVFLKQDGRGKAPVKPAKMSLGPIRGAAIWFGEPAETLVIVEGPEDGMTCHMAGYFTAAACGAFNLKNLTIPPMVQKIIIGADHGEAGEKSAHNAAQAYLRQGYEVRKAFPPVGHDWNSYWLASGREMAA